MSRATTPEPKQRFVECGGWIKVNRSIKLKTTVASCCSAAWLISFAMTIFYRADAGADSARTFWVFAAGGQISLIAAATLLNYFEKPIIRETLIPNPRKKPHALY